MQCELSRYDGVGGGGIAIGDIGHDRIKEIGRTEEIVSQSTEGAVLGLVIATRTPFFPRSARVLICFGFPGAVMMTMFVEETSWEGAKRDCTSFI